MTDPARAATVGPPDAAPAASSVSALSRDAVAGIAAAAVLMTQAMAFGITLYTPHIGSTSAGALAGLVGAAVLSLFSGLSRGTAGMISGPTGPVMALLVAITAALASAGLSGSALVQGLAVVVVVAGCIQVLLGLTGAGRIVKLVPVPVVAGFMTGSGALMIKSQIAPVAVPVASGGALPPSWIPAVTAFATMVAMWQGARRIPAVPAVIPGLLAGIGAFYGLCWWFGVTAPAAWMIGELPRLAWSELAARPSLAGQLPWLVVMASAVTLAVFTSLDTLLTSVVADAGTGERHNVRREVVAQGLGHVVVGLSGGMAGAGTTAATMVAVRSGGRRHPGAFLAVFVLICLVGADRAATYLPVSALAGVVVFVALGLIERNIWLWIQSRRTRLDACIALAVLGVTVIWDLMIAVGVGVLIAAIQFVTAQARTPVVLRRATGATIRSQRMRGREERAVLDRHGDAVVACDLRGSLVFATADRLFEDLLPDLEHGARVVISLKRVAHVDLTGVNVLCQIAARARSKGGEVVFANVHKRTGLSRKIRKSLRRAGIGAEMRVKTFVSADVALEYAEDRLLEAHGALAKAHSVELARSELCEAMHAGIVARLDPYFARCEVARRGRVYEAGGSGGTLYVVRRGNIDLRLPIGHRHWSRLARVGPGMLFGEVSFQTPGAHTATAVATEPCELYTLERDSFERLSAEDPEAALAVLRCIVRVLGRRLRQANREIYLLNQF